MCSTNGDLPRRFFRFRYFRTDGHHISGNVTALATGHWNFIPCSVKRRNSISEPYEQERLCSQSDTTTGGKSGHFSSAHRIVCGIFNLLSCTNNVYSSQGDGCFPANQGENCDLWRCRWWSNNDGSNAIPSWVCEQGHEIVLCGTSTQPESNTQQRNNEDARDGVHLFQSFSDSRY